MIKKELQHLTAKQIEMLIDDYENSEMKIQKIIEKYKLNVHPRNLVQCLPEASVEKQCPNCMEHREEYRLVRKIRPRQKKDILDVYYCTVCGHKEYENGQRHIACTCRSCYRKAEASEIKFMELPFEDQMRILEFMKMVQVLQFSTNGRIECSDTKIYDHIDCEEEFNVLLMYREEIDNTEPAWRIREMKQLKLEEWTALVDELLEKGYLSVALENEKSVFTKRNRKQITDYRNVLLRFNVFFSSSAGWEIKAIENGNFFWMFADIDELVGEYRRLLVNQTLKMAKDMLSDYFWDKNWERVDMISDEQLNRFYELAEKISYQQILGLLELIRIKMPDWQKVGYCFKYDSPMRILSDICRMYDSCIARQICIPKVSIYDWKLDEEFVTFLKEKFHATSYILEEVLGKKAVLEMRERARENENKRLFS